MNDLDLGADVVDATASLLARVEPARLLAGLTCRTDDEYLAWLVETLRDVGEMSFAFVGELIGEDEDRVRTIALATPAGPGENFEYDLADTPCATVVAKTGSCAYPSTVAPQFPKDEMLVEMGIESYVGIGLLGPSGRVNGLMVMLDQKPIPAEHLQPLEDLLRVFRGRTEHVLATRRALRDLENFEAHLDPIQGEDAPAELTRAVTQALRVRLAFVARFVDPQRTRLRTIAVSERGKPGPAFEFELAGSPFEHIGEDRSVVVSERARERFSSCEFLGAQQAEGFVGRVVDGHAGVPLGYFGIVHDRPLNRSSADHPVFKLVAERVAFELQRLEADDQRRALERRRIETQRIESLGILAGGVAHDFNNLLVGVIGNADLALSSLPPDSPTHAYVTDIVESAEAATRLCLQMLAYAGRSQLQAARFELGPLVRNLTGLLRASIPKHCELDLRIAPTPIWLEGDATQITQIIMNLVTNAADAIGDRSGTIRVSACSKCYGAAELREFSGSSPLEPGTYACIRVEDDGCGMSEETRARVFDPFFTTKPHGHGLGLAAMLGIVARHHGGVRVVSELGRGSSFVLCLPVSDATLASAAQAPAVVREPGVRARILVVDDEPHIRKVLTTILRKEGHQVLQACDGLEALDLIEAETQPIDLVILDVSMPKLDGVQTLARIRALDSAIKVVLSSGRGEVDDSVGPDLFVRKPYRVQTLLAGISQLLGGRQQSPAHA